MPVVAGDTPTRRTLVYFGAEAPAPRPGSLVVLYRHFARLMDEGWRVCIVLPERAEAAHAPLETIFLPARHRFDLPVRRWLPGSTALRLRAWRRRLERDAHLHEADVVFTLLPDYPEHPRLLAALCARVWHKPLCVFVHDQPEMWVKTADEKARVASRGLELLRASHRVFFVSEEMRAIYPLHRTGAARVLPPIPAGAGLREPVSWKPVFANGLRLAYAGKLHDAQIPWLLRIAGQLQTHNGRLEVITDAATLAHPDWANAPANLDRRPYFPTPGEAADHLRANASALLVGYPEDCDAMPWVRTSFPSKLIEWTHLGLPVVVVAPPETAVAGWARRKAWPWAAPSPDDPSFLRCAADLATPAGWQKAAQAARSVAQSQFDPDRIHAGFREAIESLPSTCQ